MLNKAPRVRRLDAGRIAAENAKAAAYKQSLDDKRHTAFMKEVLDLASDVFLSEAALMKALIEQTAQAEGDDFDIKTISVDLLPNAQIDNEAWLEVRNNFSYEKGEIDSITEAAESLNFYVDAEILEVTSLVKSSWLADVQMPSPAELRKQLTADKDA